jgi:8-oxo-dGTP pyrophosphatase MutT (NUDIX family)
MHNRACLLRKNERDEWELIGGKLEAGEDPRACVAREWAEETGLAVCAGRLLEVWIYHVAGDDVLIVAYQVSAERIPDAVISPEGSELAWFGLDAVESLNMPDGYKAAIRRCASGC